jgi:hypothetical protein
VNLEKYSELKNLRKRADKLIRLRATGTADEFAVFKQ